jgi:hypothetical protein
MGAGFEDSARGGVYSGQRCDDSASPAVVAGWLKLRAPHRMGGREGGSSPGNDGTTGAVRQMQVWPSGTRSV